NHYPPTAHQAGGCLEVACVRGQPSDGFWRDVLFPGFWSILESDILAAARVQLVAFYTVGSVSFGRPPKVIVNNGSNHVTYADVAAALGDHFAGRRINPHDRAVEVRIVRIDVFSSEPRALAQALSPPEAVHDPIALLLVRIDLRPERKNPVIDHFIPALRRCEDLLEARSKPLR